MSTKIMYTSKKGFKSKTSRTCLKNAKSVDGIREIRATAATDVKECSVKGTVLESKFFLEMFQFSG